MVSNDAPQGNEILEENEASFSVDEEKNENDMSQIADEVDNAINSEGDSLKEALSQKEAENKELFDKIQRMAAEFDNYRKRTQKEKEKLYNDSCADVVAKFLPVVDNLERAVKSAEADEGQNLKEGVALVLRQLSDILDKLGVKAIESLGREFNPELHNAVMHVEDEAYGANEIVDEFQKGYIYKDETVIRHSMVKVAN